MAESHKSPFVPPPSTQDLGSPLLRSVILHTVIVLTLWAAFGAQTRKIEAQELRVREDLARAQEELAKEQAAMEQELAQEAVRDEVRMMLTTIMHDAVVEEDLGALLQQLETSLDELFAERADGESWLDLDQESRDALRDEALAQLRTDQQDLLARTIVAQIREHVRDQLVPELRAEIENRLKNKVGKQVDKAVTKSLDQAKRDKKLDDADRRAAASAAADAIEAQVDTATATAITDELVPKASERVLEAFAKELDKLPVDKERLSALVQDDIRTALTEELSATNPSAAPVTAAIDQRHQLVDAAALDKAQADVNAARDQMSALADRQAEIREQPPTEALAKQPAQQTQVAAVTEAHTQARDALDAANRITSDDKVMREARKQTSEAKAVAEASKAERQLRNGVIEDAVAAMAASEEQLRETAAALDQASKSIGEQADAARALAALPITASAAAAAAAEAAAAAAAELASTEAAKAVAGAAQQVKIGSVLGDGERLRRLAELGRRLDEASSNLAEGRSLGGPSLLPSAGLLSGPPGQGSGIPGFLPGGRARYNRDAYERFVKDLQNRMNPDNAYGDIDTVQGLASRHSAVPTAVAEQVMVTESQTAKLERLRTPPPDAPERSLAEPDFPTPAWGGAPMMDRPVTIDGDLSDWGELTHPLTIQWNGDDGTNRRDTGITVHLRWSARGLFLAYRVPDTGGMQLPPANGLWNGEACEWWVDLDNSRRDNMARSDTAHQFLFAPFGVTGDPTYRLADHTNGQRGMGTRSHRRDDKGTAVGKPDGAGYTVECFIDRSALSKPVLLPGQILAMNVSVNLGPGHGNHWQWSSSKAIGTHVKPDTWGDVVLLGADARLRFTAIADPEETVDWTLPGMPLGLEITDADMNLRMDLRDRVAGTLGVEGRPDRLFVVLEETGPDTGVFRASVDVSAFADADNPGALAARSGSIVTLTYQDPRAVYGEENREVKAWIPVAHPVQRLAGSSTTP